MSAFRNPHDRREWLARLTSPDPAMRVEAVNALEQYASHRSVARALRDVVRAGDTAERCAALAFKDTTFLGETEKEILEATRHPDSLVRRAAVRALVGRTSPAARSAILAAMHDVDADLRRSITRGSADAGGRIGRDSASSCPSAGATEFAGDRRSLEAGLKSSDPTVRRDCLRVLLRDAGGERLHGLVLAASTDPDAGVLGVVIDLLQEFAEVPSELAQVVFCLMDASDPSVREAMGRTFRSMRSRRRDASAPSDDQEPFDYYVVPDVLPHAIHRLEDPDDEVRGEFAIAVGMIAVHGLQHPKCRDCTHDRSHPRHAAGSQLGAAIEALSRRLEDEDVEVRLAAVWSLGKVLQRFDASLAPLERSLRDEDDLVRDATLDQLQRIGAPAVEVADCVELLLRDRSPRVRAGALGVFSTAVPGREGVLRFFLDGLRDEHESVRIRALWGIIHHRESARVSIPQVKRLLQDPSSDVRHIALTALAWMRAEPAETVPLIVEALDSLTSGGPWYLIRAAGRFREGATELSAPLHRLLERGVHTSETEGALENLARGE